MEQDFYEIFGVPRAASQEEIQAAYKRLAKQHHPDAGEGSDAEKFKAINNIYEVLSDPVKRRFYDRNDFYDPDFESSISEAAASLFLMAVKRGVRDPVRATVEHVFQEVAGYRVSKAKLEAEVQRLTKSIDRIRSPNRIKRRTLEQAIQARIDDAQTEIQTAKRRIIVGDAIRDYFSEVSWEVEASSEEFTHTTTMHYLSFRANGE